MARLKLATLWLGGCSGCHMSFLDLDEWLLELTTFAEIVYSPLIDTKKFPDQVDVTLVEGAVANEDHFHLIQQVRKNSKLVASFGDCAISGNVTAVRNRFQEALPLLQRSYIELADVQKGIPNDRSVVPALLDRVRPLHSLISVDYFLPGCPPTAKHIRMVLESLPSGKPLSLHGNQLKFG